jgi:hypothetical protein
VIDLNSHEFRLQMGDIERQLDEVYERPEYVARRTAATASAAAEREILAIESGIPESDAHTVWERYFSDDAYRARRHEISKRVSASFNLINEEVAEETVDVVVMPMISLLPPAWRDIAVEMMNLEDPESTNWVRRNHIGEFAFLVAMLPATLEELDDFAMERRWCSVWGRLKQAARESGLLDRFEEVSAS